MSCHFCLVVFIVDANKPHLSKIWRKSTSFSFFEEWINSFPLFVQGPNHACFIHPNQTKPYLVSTIPKQANGYRMYTSCMRAVFQAMQHCQLGRHNTTNIETLNQIDQKAYLIAPRFQEQQVWLPLVLQKKCKFQGMAYLTLSVDSKGAVQSLALDSVIYQNYSLSRVMFQLDR